MACATVEFTDPGRLAETGFPKVTELQDQQVYLEPEISPEYCFEDLVGKSQAIQKVLEQVAIVAPTDSTVLLHGETGTGKELIARAIHKLKLPARAHICQTELCRHSIGTAGKRTVWAREGSLHGSSDAKKGPIRAGRRRLAVFG